MAEKEFKLSIEDAHLAGIVNNGDKIEYNYNSAQVFISHMRWSTGISEKQTFITEDLDWRIVKMQWGFIAVPSKATECELSLYGEQGYVNGIDIMHHIPEMCYMDFKLAQKVESIDGVTFFALAALGMLPKEGKPYWVAQRWNSEGHGMGILTQSCIHGIQECLYDPELGRFKITKSLLPIAHLKSSLCLANPQEGNGKTIPWKFE